MKKEVNQCQKLLCASTKILIIFISQNHRWCVKTPPDTAAVCMRVGNLWIIVPTDGDVKLFRRMQHVHMLKLIMEMQKHVAGHLCVLMVKLLDHQMIY